MTTPPSECIWRVLMPLVKCGKELSVTVRVDTVDLPILAEVDDVYKQWTVEEAEVCMRAEQDIQMGEENMQEIGDKGTAVKMSHVEVPQLAHKTVTRSDNELQPKVLVPPGSKTCDGCAKMKQGCEKSNKEGGGKSAQAGASVACATKAPKAGTSKWAHDDDDNDVMEVVEGKTCGKGKAPVHGGFNDKTTLDILQALGMVRAEAVAVHAANLHLQVCVKQLSEALARLGVE
ncbi:hypothetical protein BKA82DRAFT_4346259 [Pisolithus tinctorius]|nr:hypothetical protein BKA82DRAFT_4346259 [Pisolithus tinctorius]